MLRSSSKRRTPLPCASVLLRRQQPHVVLDSNRCALHAMGMQLTRAVLPTELTVIMCSQLFLYPIGAIAVAVPFCVLLGFNPTRFTLSIYF